MSKSEPAWKKAHEDAVFAGRLNYVDPETGYQVFSSLGLQARGKCCGSGCRHCPYEHEAVPERSAKRAPQFFTGERPKSRELNVLFWSGGKDSFLALCTWLKSGVAPESIVLLTTFDPAQDLIAHQEIRIQDAMAQARRLELPLLGVPLISGEEYVSRIELSLRLLQQKQHSIKRLAFGDLHLEHVLSWRTKNLAPLAELFGASLDYPVLRTAYPELLDLFELSGASARVSASTVEAVQVGQEFSRAFAKALPSDVDSFGERGEFHTLVVPNGSVRQLLLSLQ